MSRAWPVIPQRVLGHPVPSRFRRLSARFKDPDRLLVDFIDWLEDVAGSPTPPPASAATPTPAAVPPPPEPAAAAPGNPGRRDLLEACIDVSERVPQAALERRLRDALAAAGVVPLSGDGERFDANRHFALGRVPTSDPSLHDRVASTQRAGYRDGEVVLRPPEVLVYAFERNGDADHDA